MIRNIDLRATWIRAVDMDGDGDMDALSTAIGFDIVAWHENVNGDGLTWVTRLVSAATRDPQAAVAHRALVDRALRAHQPTPRAAATRRALATPSSWKP